MPDLAPTDDTEDLVYDPNQHQNSFWNRIALPEENPWPNKKDLRPQLATVDADVPQPRSCPLKSPTRRPSRPVVPGLPRPTTFKRQDSEKRDRLKPHEPCAEEKRYGQLARKRAYSASRPTSPRAPLHRRSAPEIGAGAEHAPRSLFDPHPPPLVPLDQLEAPSKPRNPNAGLPDVVSPPDSPHSSLDDERMSRHSGTFSEGLNDPAFWRELESRWILNLSMNFRDNSEREKFFITYAEEPNRWRRVTVSVDYRKKPAESLEADLKTLPFQRDKSAHIYEAIHESLSSVQFYETVTNLRLETADGRLHVHVTQDVNEIIKYPPLSAIEHLEAVELVTESELHFQSHLSGFVYRVAVGGQSYIKKEIPGPDMIDEFLYEVNALWKLSDSDHVIDFCKIVTDDSRTCIKGLLISFADKGTLVDIIYDNRDPPLPWATRDKWARQIVQGLADIHEEGFVQGDFTLSNIVIDSNDDVRIIDINRRGCPVGWEPPEFLGLIESGQKISMHIGTKSDLYQLGMVLWGLARLEDEPEQLEGDRTLEGSDAPEYLIKWVKSCLSDKPKHRLSAKDLLRGCPELDAMEISTTPIMSRHNLLNVPHVMGDCEPDDFDGNWEHVLPYHQHRPISPADRELQHEDGNLVTTEHAHRLHDKDSHTPPQCDSYSQQLFHMPPHQDSGLGGMEGIPHFRHPTHQDSGLGEDILNGAPGPPIHTSIVPSVKRRSGLADLACSGAQFGE